MTRFHDIVGFVELETPQAGLVVGNKVTERKYFGTVMSNRQMLAFSSASTNEDTTMSNIFRLHADTYMLDHIATMRYLRWRGTNWKITAIQEEGTAISATIGGVYNGATTDPDSTYTGDPSGF